MDGDTPELTLADYLAVLRRRWRTIAAVTLLVAAAALVWSLTRPDRFRARTNVLVSAQATNQTLDPTAGQVRDVARQVENELVFAASRDVREAAAERLGIELDLSVSGQSKSADLLTFTAEGADPVVVARAADLYAQTFIDLRTRRIVEGSARTRQVIDERLAALRERLDRDDAGDGTADAARTALTDQIALYERYTSGLDLMADLAAASNAQIVAAAEVPDAPFSPRPARSTTLALVVGLMIGTGLAFLREFLDDRIRTTEQLERAVGAVPNLAVVPLVARRAIAGTVDPHLSGPLGETFRNLRTAVQFAGLRGDLHVIQVTSSVPSEGKTTVSTNLAVALAHSGTPVALVDADLRRPQIAARFALAGSAGLTDVMVGDADLDTVLQPVAGCDGLVVITSGPCPANAADFLWPSDGRSDTPTFAVVLRSLVDRGYTVIVDSPPVLPVADARTIARAVDGTLFVAAAGLSSRREVAAAVESLRQVDARFIGTVLNQMSDTRAGGYRYGYGRGYGDGAEPTARRRWRLFRRGPARRGAQPTAAVPTPSPAASSSPRTPSSPHTPSAPPTTESTGGSATLGTVPVNVADDDRDRCGGMADDDLVVELRRHLGLEGGDPPPLGDDRYVG